MNCIYEYTKAKNHVYINVKNISTITYEENEKVIVVSGMMKRLNEFEYRLVINGLPVGDWTDRETVRSEIYKMLEILESLK